MNVIAWKVWYPAGVTFNSIANNWSDLPGTGFQIAILWFDEIDPSSGQHYRRILHGTNFYMLCPPAQPEVDGTVFGQANTLLDAQNRGVIGTTKVGTTLPDVDYRILLLAALSQRDAPTLSLGVKSA